MKLAVNNTDGIKAGDNIIVGDEQFVVTAVIDGNTVDILPKHVALRLSDEPLHIGCDLAWPVNEAKVGSKQPIICIEENGAWECTSTLHND